MKIEKVAAVIMLACVITFACNDDIDPCDVVQEGATYMLSDTVKNYFENYRNANQIIFSKSNGEEVAFVLSGIQDVVTSYAFSKVCLDDSTQQQRVRGEAQIMSIFLESEDLLKPVYMQLVEYPLRSSTGSYEAVEVYYGPLIQLEDGDGLFSYSTNSPNPNAEISNSLLINGTMYFDVIRVKDPVVTPNLEVSLTEKLGIVHIVDLASGEEYNYLRKE